MSSTDIQEKTVNARKVQQFMESPLVAWAMTFDDYNTVETAEDIADGILLNKIMSTVDSSAYSMSKVNRSVARDPALRMQNLQLLVSRIKHFYLTSLQQLVITSLPNISVISHTPESDYSFDELEKLLVLLLGCVVQCEGKVPLIERMKTMTLHQQQALVVHIQSMTDTTDYVCSIDWNDLEEISKPNLEGLCRTAYIHLQRVTKERDHHYDTLVDVVLERDYYKQLHQQNPNDSLPHENGLPLSNTPIRSPSINADVLDLKKRCRHLQEQLDRKVEMVTDLKDDLEQARNSIQRLQQEKRELIGDAKSVRIYRDEIETLKVQAARSEKLEADVVKYRQKAEDTEYLKKRIADLKQQNDLTLETKALLEQKAASLTARADAVDDLETELASLKVQLDSLNQEKEMDLERIEELLAQNAQLELDTKHYHEKVTQLTGELEMERERSTSEVSSGDTSNLSFEMSEADLASKARVLRLEKEARELEKSTEQLRHAHAKVSELEKTNKKLYSQTHTDRKEIIKLREEVEVLKVKASRVDKLQVELNSQRERLEEATRLAAKLKDMKGKKEVIMEAKAKLEDEVESLHSKVSLLEGHRDDNASLKAQVESLTSEHDEDQKRIQVLLEQNAQLDLEKQKCSEEIVALQTELGQERSRNGPNAPVTVLSPPRITEADMASRAKLQRLEKETREMEKTMEALRHSQAKCTELEKTNKKLQEQTHSDRKEIIKLKEEMHTCKVKADRMDRVETEMKAQEQKLEDIDAARRKIAELKQQNALLSESKLLLQEEIGSIQTKFEKLTLEVLLHCHQVMSRAENAALQVRVGSMEEEMQEESLRMQELLQQNAQLELEKEKTDAEIDALNTEITQVKLNQSAAREVPFSPAGPTISDAVFGLQSKLLRVEKENRELGRSLEVLQQSSERAASERDNMHKKLTSQIHGYRKEIAKLKEELRQGKSQVSKQLTRLKSVDGDPDQKQAKQFQELESRFNEAYSQSLTTKDERIQVLENRVEEITSENGQLRDELAGLRKQNEKTTVHGNRRNSPAGSPGPGMTRTYSPREINRLKEQAADTLRLREKLHRMQEENHHLHGDLLDAKHVVERQEANSQRLADRIQMLEQLNHTLEEEKRTLLVQLNKLLGQNQELLMKTLESKEIAFEDERLFNDRLGELERDKARLSEKLVAQQREHLHREMESLKNKNKSKNILKKGFKKLKGKLQGRTHTFEHMDGSGLDLAPSQQSLSSSVNLGSPMGVGMPIYAVDGSMSSSQSISSSNSGRHSDAGQEDLDPDGSTLIPRAPTFDGSPFLRPRKARSYTMPAGMKRPHSHASIPSVEQERIDELMSLEDFLAESDKTPNRRRVMELKRASLILNTPPVTPRNSLLLTTTNNGGGQMFDLQEFLTKFDSEDTQEPIPEVEETEPEPNLQDQPTIVFQHSLQSSTSGLSQSDDPPTTIELNVEGNSNNSNNNNKDNAITPTAGGKNGLSSSTPTGDETPTTVSWGNASTISGASTDRSGEKRALQGVKSTSQSDLAPLGSHRDLQKSKSSDSLSQKNSKGKKKGKLTKKTFFSSSEDLLGADKRVTGKPPIVIRKVHKSSADLVDHRKRNVNEGSRDRASSTGARASLSGLTDLSQKGETQIRTGSKKSKNRNRLSLPSWGSRPAESPILQHATWGSKPVEEISEVQHATTTQDSAQSPKSDEDSVWFEYGAV